MMMFFIRVVLMVYETKNLKSKRTISDFNNYDFLLIVVSAGNYLNGILV